MAQAAQVGSGEGPQTLGAMAKTAARLRLAPMLPQRAAAAGPEGKAAVVVAGRMGLVVQAQAGMLIFAGKAVMRQ